MPSERRFLILDIETILDRNLTAQVFGLQDDVTPEQLQEAIKTKYPSGFPPPPFHSPICIALIDVDSETSKVHNATVLENPDEKSLLQQFWKVVKFRKGNPVKTILVHFNGRGFDLPVLFYRSLKHRIQVVSLEDRNRYSFEFSHDICDDLSEFGATGRISLNIVAKLLGFPGKTEIDGSQIEDLYGKGERQKIRDYCMDDALSTYYVWLTMRYARNQLTEEMYREACETAAETVRSCRALTENFGTPTVD